MITRRRLLVAVFLLGVVLSVFSQERGEWYQGKVIRDIVFTGLKHVKAADLEGLVSPYKGLVFDDNIFWEIQMSLYQTEYFEQISPSAVAADALGNEVIIRFEVTERPVISRINFVGNTGIRRNELLDTIALKINDVINQAKIRVDEQAIINKYLEKGYPDIQVRSDTQVAGDSTLVLTFYINEGEKISIKEFIFEGNSVFSDRTLRGQLSLKVKTLINDGAFQEAKLLEDRNAIVNYYHARGYIEAAVIDVTREIQRDEKGNNNLILTFRIFEGKIFTFGGVTFEGNQIFSTEQLERLITSKPGETINALRLEADLQRVADLYFENGYIFNTIGRQENKDSAASVISYHIPIVERGRAHIENIIIRGNTKTKDEVILREIPMEPGDVFSKTKILDGMRNLYNLQYFSMVVPDTLAGSTDSLMDLVINVEEAPTTDLQLGLTFSGSSDPDTFPVSALIKWNDRNFRGTGNQLGADLNASPDTVSAALNYTHRWIFGLPLSGGFDFTGQWMKRLAPLQHSALHFNGDETYAFPEGFSTFQEYERHSKIPPDAFLMTYHQWYLSFGFSTGYRWSTFLGNLSLSGGLRFGWIRNDYDANLRTPFDPTLRENNNDWTLKNSFWSSVALDQRDIYYDPSNGYYVMDRFGIYGLFDTEREHYIRNDAKAEYFFTLFDIPVSEKWNFKSVFGLHTGLSLIVKQPGRNLELEDANKLAIDGMFIGRGWSGEYSQKGYALWESWAELRFPLVPGVLAWDFFFDAATIETRPETISYFERYSWDSMRFSFGGGFRFTIPQFPFRFSLAKRFNFEDGQFRWQPGAIGASADNPAAGIDFVISFALSTY
ncbi:MAG TPA: outer membrane protein assembly factor BamA [Treponema sp.]|nr:outer membrane protein assembly factor BamA [Treponema sp.]